MFYRKRNIKTWRNVAATDVAILIIISLILNHSDMNLTDIIDTAAGGDDHQNAAPRRLWYVA